MRLPITPATTLQRELRGQLRHNRPAGRVVVLVDGFDPERDRVFADSFAAVLAEDGSDVVRASLRDFLREGTHTSGDLAPESIDIDTVRRALLDPFREGGQTGATTGFQVRSWDARREQPYPSQWVTAAPDALLVLDGPFALLRDIRASSSFSLWLDVPQSQLAQRPGRSGAEPYTTAEFSYLRAEQPLTAASALIDVSDPTAPFEFYRDFC